MDVPVNAPVPTSEPAADAPRLARRKLWSVAVIVYGSLALLFVAMPNQVASRLVDLGEAVSLLKGPEPHGQDSGPRLQAKVVQGLEDVVKGLQKGVSAVAAVSDRTGIETVYEDLRTRFQAIVPHGSGG